MLAQAATTGEASQRVVLYGEAQRLLRAELPIIPLWHEDQIAVVSDRARGFTPSAEGRWLSLAEIR